MANLSSRITLQESRFSLIQQAAEDALDGDRATVNRQMISTRLEVLETNWTKFQDQHENICQNEIEFLVGQPYMKNKIFERCQEFYIHARAALLTQQEEIEFSNPSTRSSGSLIQNSSHSSNKSSLPRISLPQFSGDYQSWRSFYDLFTSMVSNNTELSNVEKLHYLRTCLTGEALRVISNLTISGDNFSIAWNVLIERYENKRFLISAQLDRLLNIKPLKNRSARGLRTLLTTVTECLGALQALGCLTHQWNPLLLHQLIRLLDENTREAWEVKIGSCTNYPSFAQFEEFLNNRARAMENIGGHHCNTSSGSDRSNHTTIKGDTRVKSV